MTIQTLNPKEEQLEMSEDNKMLTLVDGFCYFSCGSEVKCSPCSTLLTQLMSSSVVQTNTLRNDKMIQVIVTSGSTTSKDL